MTLSSWLPWALLSALFAALTAIFAKVGIEAIESDFATLVQHRRRRAHPGGAGLCDGQVAEPARDPAEVRALPRALGAGHRRVLVCHFPRLQPGDPPEVAPVHKLRLG